MIIKNGVLVTIEKDDVINGTVTIPNTVTVIGSHVIDGTVISNVSLSLDDDIETKFPKNIKNIVIPKTVTKIEKEAFIGLDFIENIEFEEGIQLTDIGANAFNGCASLSEIKIPETVTTIDVDAFRGCSNIENLTFPKDSTVIISESSFENCESLKELHFLGRAKTCDDDKESGINLVAKNVKVLEIWKHTIIRDLWERLTQISLPEGVIEIGEKAFGDFLFLESVIMPNSIENIADDAFHDCSKLKNIMFSNKLKKIGDGAFYNCKSIERIDLPKTIESIGAAAFAFCRGIQEIWTPKKTKNVHSTSFLGTSGRIIRYKTNIRRTTEDDGR